MHHPLVAPLIDVAGRVLGALVLGLGRLPLGVSRTLAAWLGLAAFAVRPRWRRRTHEQLARALPGLDARERARIARGAFVNAGRVAVEMVHASVRGRGAVDALCDDVDALHAALARDRAEGAGVVLLTGHLGNWELLPWLMPDGVDVAAITDRPVHSWLDTLLGRRAASGTRLIHNDGDLRDAMRTLRRGGVLIVLPDQDLRRSDGIFVPFFGRPAWTTTGPVELAARTGAVLRPVYVVREGSRFRVVVHEPIAVPRSPSPTQVAEATAAWTEVLEREIRARPAQWLWMHRRWRTRPRPTTGATGAAGVVAPADSR